MLKVAYIIQKKTMDRYTPVFIKIVSIFKEDEGKAFNILLGALLKDDRSVGSIAHFTQDILQIMKVYSSKSDAQTKLEAKNDYNKENINLIIEMLDNQDDKEYAELHKSNGSDEGDFFLWLSAIAEDFMGLLPEKNFF